MRDWSSAERNHGICGLSEWTNVAIGSSRSELHVLPEEIDSQEAVARARDYLHAAGELPSQAWNLATGADRA